MSINFSELREFLTALAQTDISELTLKSENLELTVRKGFAPVITPTAISTPVAVNPPPTVAAPTPVVTPQAVETPVTPTVDKKWTAIASPMVGTFYRASAPDEPAFVEIGDRITKGQTVCILEAMKLMNDLESDFAGTVMEIVVKNGEPVEYGQTLMWIKTD